PTARPAARGRNWPAGRAARCAARRRPRRPLAPGQAARGSGSLRQTPCRCRTGRPRVRAPSARRVSSPVPERFGFRRVSCGVPRVNLTSVRTLSPLRTLVVTVLALLLIAAVPATAKAPRKVPAAFMGALTRRYGPGGSFWTEHPELTAQPIRYWQIWNEPSFNTFWSDQPFADDYVALVRASRNAIKAVDPGAKIVLAGLPNKSWNSLEKIYKAGGKDEFDIAGFHPFTAKVDGVRTILEKDRKVMSKYHDSKK